MRSTYLKYHLIKKAKMRTIEEHFGKELPFVRKVCDRFTLDSEIYQIDEGILAKVYHEGIEGDLDGAKMKALYEYGIAKRLYDSKISVPCPKGVFLVPIKTNSTERYPSFVMEYISGYTLRELENTDFRDRTHDLVQKAQVELEKAEKLGFIPKDLCLSNLLWSPNTNEIYLIDFTQWKDHSLSLKPRR